MLVLVLEIGIQIMNTILNYSLKVECLAGHLEKILRYPFNFILIEATMFQIFVTLFAMFSIMGAM